MLGNSRNPLGAKLRLYLYFFDNSIIIFPFTTSGEKDSDHFQAVPFSNKALYNKQYSR